MDRPRLKATIVVPPATPTGQLGLLLGNRRFDIRFAGGRSDQLTTLFSCLTGAYTEHELCERTKLPREALVRTVGKLRDSGLVYQYDGAEHDDAPIPATELLEIFESIVAALRYAMFGHPLFGRLLTDQRLFLAAAVEYFHLIRDAESHIRTAWEHAPEELQALLAEYLDSEKDHYRFIEPPLKAAIGGAIRSEDLMPMAATEAVMLKTRELARSDTLAYLACCSFLETQKILAPLVAPEQWPPALASVLRAFVRHADEDTEASHSSLFAETLRSTSSAVSRLRAAQILSSVHEVKHYFDNLNFEIFRVYSQPGAPFPRLRPRLVDFSVPQ
jgi:hypothetical protein